MSIKVYVWKTWWAVAGLVGLLVGLLVITMPSAVSAAIGDCNAGTGAGLFPVGDGSAGNPYLVTSSSQLVAIDTADCLDENFQQGGDIALSGAWIPIGSVNNGFVGTYDGGGYRIIGLELSGSNAGLFEVGSAGAAFSRLNISVSDSTSAIENVGALVGSAYGDLRIDDVHVSGNVSGSGAGIGGLVGGADKTVVVSRSSVTGNVSAGSDASNDSFVGGIIGFADETVTISDTSMNGDVVGTGNSVGGLVGDVITPNGTLVALVVSDSEVTGNVSGTGSAPNLSALVGGVIGSADNAVTISDSSVNGNVSGTGDSVGGLVGFSSSSVVVTGSLLKGNISAGSDASFTSYLGGVIGVADGSVTISATSVIGDVTGTDERVGGLVGDAPATLSVSSSSVTGNITGYAFIGGVVGYANSGVSISRTAVIGDVTGGMNGVGGLVGKSFVGPLTTENSFFRGIVTGGCFCFGGIVGSDNGQANTTLTNTYVAESGLEFVGDFLDSNSSAQDPSYVDSFCTGTSVVNGESCEDVNSNSRVAVSQLQSQLFLEGKGWDFDNVWCVSSSVNNGYPVLRAIKTPAVGFAACWTPAVVNSPARPVASILRATFDPNSGACTDAGRRQDMSWSTNFVGYRYLPADKECEREGYTFVGWADVAQPEAVLELPRLVHPTDGVARPFLTRRADLIAVWKVLAETDADIEDLTGTAPGAFVGGADRRTREGGGVVDGYYIPPNTLFWPWLATEDLTGTVPGAFVGGVDRRTREGGAVVDGYYIPPETVFGPWMLAW